ncbi:unnamed protein product [Haemonchus placei]|uniref:EGF-like domain-containing protein n=1 Tax=Haemonchus placei TaxID=6290 RepID=A0A158QKP8_HAEPC|nr:unnamed protein product [Haemonchus placei]
MIIEFTQNYSKTRLLSCRNVSVPVDSIKRRIECFIDGYRWVAKMYHSLRKDQCRIKLTFQICTNCRFDEDCLNGGKCIVEFNSMVFASCYCSYGFFGKNCEKCNGEDECFAYAEVHEERFNAYGMFDPDCYNMKKFSDSDFVYYRKTESDVEIILDFASTSWVSIGWRPEGLDKSCRLFPDLEGMMFLAQEGPRPIMPRNNGLLDSALHAPLHPMDCVDVLIGAVRNGRIRYVFMCNFKPDDYIILPKSVRIPEHGGDTPCSELHQGTSLIF